ncbi:MAG: hypothetical protein IJ268_08730, partial [Proteobacteria bacterium]|nr:hypothetical protein [Pseudomonadota bacterium]
MHKRILFYISSIVILNSCALDDIERYGDPCPPKDQAGKLSYIKSQDCTAESCDSQNYEKNFSTGMCPSDVPVCAQDDSGLFYCTAIQCEQDEHIYNGHCEPDDLENCGQHDYSCAHEIPGWETGSCRSGKCHADSCQEGYTVNAGKCNALTECSPDQHLYKGICEEDDIYNCGSHGNVCQNMISGWIDGECRNSLCSATACDSAKGYDLFNGKCEARIGCDIGMHYYNGQCEPDDLNNCGSHGNICTERAGWISGGCELVNSHKECQSDSECSGGVCRENECFKTECVVTECESIYEIKDGKCVPRTECDAGQHLYQNQCEPDSIDNCGEHNLQCKNIIQGWAFGTCTDMTCVPLSCAAGYHLSGKTCEQDSPSACGDPPSPCAPGQLCSNGECKDDCDSSMIRCMRDSYTAVCIDPQSDNTFCGADAQCQNYKTCASGQNCLNGQCIQTSCPNSSETLCANACVNLYAADAQNCGSCGYVCANHPQSHATSNTCLKGKCQFQCEAGYTNCGTPDLPNCIPTSNFNTDSNNCGSCGHTCAAKDEFCQAGTCVKSTCNNSCLYNNQCINETNHCGISCTDCSALSNVSSSTCDSSGQCKINSCNASAHLYNNTCEPDSQANCGSHDNACAALITGWANGTCTDKQCRATACKASYHLYNNTCEPDSDSHCGSHGNACAHGETCQNKTCKCPGGYTTINNVKAACISSAEDFLSFRNAINEGKNWPSDNDNATFALTRNIDLGTQNSWVGTGTGAHPFSGTILG